MAYHTFRPRTLPCKMSTGKIVSGPYLLTANSLCTCVSQPMRWAEDTTTYPPILVARLKPLDSSERFRFIDTSPWMRIEKKVSPVEGDKREQLESELGTRQPVLLMLAYDPQACDRKISLVDHILTSISRTPGA
jgi:hypothetical protein